MTENVENPTGAPSDPAEHQDPTSSADAGYDAAQDADADPESMNARDLRGEGSREDDPDLDPDGLNPRGDA